MAYLQETQSARHDTVGLKLSFWKRVENLSSFLGTIGNQMLVLDCKTIAHLLFLSNSWGNQYFHSRGNDNRIYKSLLTSILKSSSKLTISWKISFIHLMVHPNTSKRCVQTLRVMAHCAVREEKEEHQKGRQDCETASSTRNPSVSSYSPPSSSP